MIHDRFETELPPVEVTPVMRGQWKVISGWALFSGIFSLLIVILIAFLGAVVSIVAYGMYLQFNHPTQGIRPELGAASVLLLIPVVIFLVMLVAAIYHILFYAQMRKALKNGEQQAFERAWVNLRNHFRWYGVCTVLYIIIILGTFVVVQYLLNPFRSPF